MTDVPPAHVAPMAQIGDLSAEFDRGRWTRGLRHPDDHRTHVDRISSYNEGESYAGAHANSVQHPRGKAAPSHVPDLLAAHVPDPPRFVEVEADAVSDVAPAGTPATA